MAVLRDIISLKLAALLVVVGFIASIYVRRYMSSRKIAKLGVRAPVVQSTLPLGMDFPVRSVQTARQNKVMEMWQDMLAESGATAINSYTCEFTILEQMRLLFTADPVNIKAILTGQFADFGKGERFHEEWKAFLGDSIFATDGKQWADSRALIRPMFMRERVADLDIVEEHVEKLLRLVGDGDGAMVRFDRILSRYTLDAATHFLFGISAGSLDDEQAEFGVAFDEVQRVQAISVRAGPMRTFVPQKTFNAGLRTMDKFMEPLIQAVLDMSPSELEAKVAKSDTFLHALARYTRDRKVIRDQLVSLLLAGRDTTSSTLSWVFLELARNPQVVEKLRAEIMEVIGTSGQKPTYENIKDMKYVTWVINETLRLYPAVPFNVRSSIKDTTLPRGGGPDGTSPIGMPAGTAVGYSTLMMQRRKDLYPPISDAFPYDPHDWVPDRWATWTPKAWQFIPFNGGPRICIGQQFAMMEMGYTIARIFQKFDKIIDYGNKDILKSDIILYPAEGVKIGFANSVGVSQTEKQ